MEFERLANAIAEVLDIDASKITPDSKFVEDLGADSLDVLEIVRESRVNLELRFQQKLQKIL